MRFLFDTNWKKALSGCPAEVRLEVYEAVIDYVASGTLPNLKTMANLGFELIRTQIETEENKSSYYRDLANKRWKKCDANASAYAVECGSNAEKEEAPKEKVTPKELPEREKEQEKDIDKSISKKKDERVVFVESLPEDWQNVVKSWLRYKTDRKESYKSLSTLKIFYKNLQEYSGNNVSVAQKVIEQSIGNNYQGIFPLKNQSSTTGKPKFDVPKSPDEYYKNVSGFIL